MSEAKGQYYRPSNNVFVRIKEEGLAPLPGLSFVNIIFVDSEEWRLAPPFRVGDRAIEVNSALAFVGN